MSSISGEADLHPSTLVRFARRLGFDNYDDFRAEFRSDVRYKLGRLARRRGAFRQEPFLAKATSAFAIGVNADWSGL